MEECNIRIGGHWTEQEIVQKIAMYAEPSFLKIGGGSFCHKVITALHRATLLVNNSAHNCLPPDFFSDDLDIMFDVMRVNDSEKKKGKNPVFQEMHKSKTKVASLIKRVGLENVRNVCIDLRSDNGPNYDEIHQFKYYKRQVVRVLKEHISKIQIWQSEYPTIKRKGLVVHDEAGLFLQGHAKPADVTPDGIVNEWAYFIKQPVVVHYPWMDIEFMQPLYDSKLDFVVWYRPFVYMSDGNRNLFDGKLPYLAVIDVRQNAPTSLQQYDVTNEWFSWQ